MDRPSSRRKGRQRLRCVRAALRRVVRRFANGLALLPVAAACVTSASDLPADATPFSAPARFRLWWQVVETCSGLSGDFSRVRWYTVPRGTLGADQAGYTYYSFPPRVLLENGWQQNGEQIVRHEMLHALGVQGHPKAFFLDGCGDLVSCVRACSQEAGSVPNGTPADTNLPGATLRLTVRVFPDTTSLSRDSGAAVVLIEASNPSDTGYWIGPVLSPASGNGRGVFWWRSPTLGGFDFFGDSSMLWVPARFTRRHAFDLVALQASGVGPHIIVAGVAVLSAPAAPVVVVP